MERAPEPGGSKVTEIKKHDDLLTGISPLFDTCVDFAQSNQEYILKHAIRRICSPISHTIPKQLSET